MLGLDGRHLVIQGPPGSGKTWTSGRLIARLLAAGKRVGVASTSHKAIHKLLDEVEAAGIDVQGVKKASAGNPESFYESEQIENVTERGRLPRRAARRRHRLAASRTRTSTAALDYLFIDEAGQVSLADALAMGTCARNLVLVGDPQQLAQVLQGTHPDGAGVSVLQHLLGDDATIPPDRGLFLETTYRLHPDVCDYISEEFYEGRLVPDARLRRRGRRRSGPGSASCRSSTTAAGRSRSSRPSASRREVGRLLAAGVAGGGDHGRRALQRAGEPAPRARCPTACAVGTVDKFQGQEADVVLYSMASLERRGRPARTRVPALAEPPERRDLARTLPRVPRLLARGCSRSTAARSRRCGSRTRSAGSSRSPRSRRPPRERSACPEVVLGAAGCVCWPASTRDTSKSG